MTEVATREWPILFSAEMVNAILAGKKTQTRRAVKPQPNVQGWQTIAPTRDSFGTFSYPAGAGGRWECPYGLRGDHLWVCENFSIRGLMHGAPMAGVAKYSNRETCIAYRADNDPERTAWKWRPSIHMPRWACRIVLEVKSVRVERLQAISKEDAIAEGIAVLPGQDASDPSAWYESAPGVNQARTAQASYFRLWDSINGKDPAKCWKANPWVWVVEFIRI